MVAVDGIDTRDNFDVMFEVFVDSIFELVGGKKS